MRNESKIILSLASLMAISLAGAATSTVAWFASARTAAVNLTDFEFVHYGSNLTVEVSSEINAYCGISEEETGITAMSNSDKKDSSRLTASTSGVYDVSSDGATFYKPTWVPDKEATASREGQASLIESYSNQAGSSRFYVKFAVKISNTGNVQANVYLDGPSSIVPADEGNVLDAAASKATRVGIYSVNVPESGPITNSLLTYWGMQTDDRYTHLGLNSADKASWDGTDLEAIEIAKANEAYKIVTSTSPKAYSYRKDGIEIQNASKVHSGSFPTLAKEADAESASNAFIAMIPSKGSAYIYVSCWIEGTSKYATNDCIGGEVGVKLSFVSFDHAGA